MTDEIIEGYNVEISVFVQAANGLPVPSTLIGKCISSDYKNKVATVLYYNPSTKQNETEIFHWHRLSLSIK